MTKKPAVKVKSETIDINRLLDQHDGIADQLREEQENFDKFMEETEAAVKTRRERMERISKIAAAFGVERKPTLNLALEGDQFSADQVRNLLTSIRNEPLEVAMRWSLSKTPAKHGQTWSESDCRKLFKLFQNDKHDLVMWANSLGRTPFAVFAKLMVLSSSRWMAKLDEQTVYRLWASVFVSA